ncbi:molybdenum cofactor guanylyltransferase [Corynebacterium doosanense]|uniref:Molybdopterin-guanine dinucleotide biosynthesis protein n=1 Tax=Corynebacterium doosanense CAU 212 = DSM 45436 TaxID=558173 RepID=A0A097IFF2_9CORY|nr:NTP transferase domain-containing protein [Corynebacterium doosanense]AIT60840.1 molybdopterin-guanine dinucleotide biosynthesis protein [Corynebacterium doosanense CAU 212 = DSM 45436]
MSVDVIILAGGRGSRMGGRDKAQVTVDGRRLIDVLLDSLDGAGRVAVVSSRPITLRPGVTLVAENPPFAGPVAAINAGLLALQPGASTHTAVLAVDAPDSASLIPPLVAALDASVSVAAVEGQPLCAVWKTAELHRVLGSLDSVVDRAAKSLFDDVPVATIPGTGAERDYDTLDELTGYGDVAVDN